jgi:hypothetical protein
MGIITEANATASIPQSASGLALSVPIRARYEN